MRKKPGNSRQQIWNALRFYKKIHIDKIIEVTKCKKTGAIPYLTALRENGYLTHHNGEYKLLKDTGPISPAYNSSKKEVHDWNINPVMSAAELKHHVELFDGSLRAFAVHLGFHPSSSNRLSKMLRNQKPVSGDVEAAIKKLAIQNTKKPATKNSL